MSLLLQISDTHFGTERPPVVESLLRLVREQAPKLVLLSGDITQRATREQFARAARFVERLGGVRVLAIPGNHDIPLFNPLLRLVAPYARHRRVFGHELEPEHACPQWLVLTLKTTRRWRHEDGQVSRRQVERVAARLRQATPGQLRLVVVHQPVAVPPQAGRVQLLHGRERALQAWAEAGADLVLGGHIHLPYVLPLHERVEGLARRLWAVQAGTAVSDRVRHEAGNSVNLIRSEEAATGGGRACVVERWDWRDAARGFEPVARERLALGPLDPGAGGAPGARSAAAAAPSHVGPAPASGVPTETRSRA